MYKIHYSKTSQSDFKRFIDSYRFVFVSLYSDTGIIDEHIIQENYRNLAKDLRKQIQKGIEKILNPKLVLGRKELSPGIFEISLKAVSFLICVTYKENIKLQERTITNISFYKK